MTSGYPILSDPASFQLLTLAFGRSFTINTLEVNIMFTNFHPEQWLQSDNLRWNIYSDCKSFLPLDVGVFKEENRVQF